MENLCCEFLVFGEKTEVDDFRQLLAVFTVLGILGATLYWLRTRGLIAFAAKAGRTGVSRRLQHLERMPLTAQHSLHLVRVEERVVLIAVSPGGCCLIQNAGAEAFHEEGQRTR
jgi:flagellar biogenesis protein FliO